MKKLLVLLAVAAFVAFAGNAMAALQAQVSVSGTITVEVSITALPATVALTDSKLSDDVTVTETSNDTSGYTVTLATANGGTGNPKLVNGGLTPISYSITYDTAAVSFTDGLALVTDVASSSGSPFSKTMHIAWAPTVFTDAVAAIYSDTLTLVIDGK